MTHDKAYYAAEKQIKEARCSGTTKLDFSVTHFPKQSELLRELPESIGQLSQLQTLNLYGNKLTTLPESLMQLTQLQELNLPDNRLTALPESLGHLTELQSLNLSNNQLTTLPEALGHLTKLQSLYLSENQLTALPESLGHLNQLKLLNLSSNKLTTLPEALSQLTQLQSLNLSNNQLTILPEWIEKLTQLQLLNLGDNQLTRLPKSLIKLPQLNSLELHYNKLYSLPDWLGKLARIQQLTLCGLELSLLPEWIYSLKELRILDLYNNKNINSLPEWIGSITQLETIYLQSNQLTDLPRSFIQLGHLTTLKLDDNPLNPELAEAYKQGLPAVMAYLRAKAEAQITLNEAKLILVGEGGVGKTSLLSALRGDPWVENRETTHGVEVDIKSLVVKDPETGREITLNGWDFGGQNIYRHTHQLFFTAPAVYLAVWDPRRGPEQCCIAEWVKMIKHRAYDENRREERPRILVVATKGGPKERLDHIDEQVLRDEFGDLITGFYHIDSKPDPITGECYQLEQLKQAIAREAASIPSVRRSVPLSWKNVLEAIRKRSHHDPYISYERFEALCNRQRVSNELAALYATILNELGHLIYYRGDETLKDTVILKPDYLSKAISFMLEDKAAKEAHGLVEHDHLCEIWNDPARPENERYPKELHSIFLRLLERFDLSYQVVMPEEGAPLTSLVAQLVPGIRPEGWEADWVLKVGDVERTQVCRVLDAETGRTVEAEGLIYRLIVRLHRYSLGRKNYFNSRHWKTGLLLDDGYNGRAFIEEIGGDVYVTVRAAYPERFLSHLCSEIQWLVDHFWKGLDARLFVPCVTEKCKGLLEIDEIMDYKSNGATKVRCSVCKKFLEIDSLMATMQPKPVWEDAVTILRSEHRQILQGQEIGFDSVSTQLRVLMSQADEQYENLLAWLSDPAKDGPRLFSFEPVNRSRFDPANWTHETFRLTLWCEHAKVPLPYLNGLDSKKGVYEIDLTREWFKKAAPILKVINTTASLVLPVASAGLKLVIDDSLYKKLDFTKEVIGASLSGIDKMTEWVGQSGEKGLPKELRADDSALRELHAFLREKDPGFGGLVRVMNKRQEFLWVHPMFEKEY